MASRETGRLVESVYAPPSAARPWTFAELLAPAQLRFYGLGRAALTDVLRAAGLTRGDPVLFPGLICREPVDAARAPGCSARFFSVAPSLEPAAAPAEWPQARAVVAVDYFGFPQDLRPFQDYVQRTGALLIEDNAHGLFSRSADGAWLGLRGDAGIFSPRKTISVPNGGLLALPNASRIPLPAGGAFQVGAPVSFQLKQALRASVPLVGLGPVRLLQRLKRSATRELDGELSQGCLAPAAMLAGGLRVADPEAEVARRRALYAWADGRVRALGGRPIFERLEDGVSPYVFPFRAEPQASAAIDEALDREGVDVFPWPHLPAELEGSAPAHYRDIRCVRFLW